MHRYIQRIAVIALSYFIYASASYACSDTIGWVNPSVDTPKMSIEEVQAKLKKDFAVNLKFSRMQPMCGEDVLYDIDDAASSARLLTFPVYQGDPRYAYARVQQIMKTPKDQLIALQSADDILRRDSEALKAQYGLRARISLENTVGNRPDISLTRTCSKTRGTQSPGESFKNRPLVGYIQYTPGISEYPPEKRYQTGDLLRAIKSDPVVMQEYKEKVHQNAENCREDRGRDFWINLEKYLSGNPVNNTIPNH